MLAPLAHVLVFFVIGAQQPPIDINQMIARKLEMRDSYSLRFRFDSRSTGQPADAQKWGFTASIWRSGDKLRVDVSDRNSDRPGAEQSNRGRHVMCRNCERENYTLVTTVLPGAPAVTRLVEFRDSRNNSADYYVPEIDWRFLGLCNVRLSLYDRVPIAKSYRERMALPLLRTFDRDRDGVRCLVTEIDHDDRLSGIWFSQKEQHNPVWHVAESKSGGIASRTTTEVRWKVTAGKHLYPEQITHSTVRGGSPSYEEVIRVLHADFDSPVDPSVFTLAGIGPNENQAIAYPDVEALDWPVWRNNRPDYSLSARSKAKAAQTGKEGPIDPGAQVPPVAAYPTSGNTSLIISAVFGGVAVFALAFAAIHRRRNRS